MKTLVVLFTMLLALTTTVHGAAAQLGSEDDPSPEDIDGLVAGYGRNYIDNETRRVSLFGYTFETDDQAEAYVSQVREGLETELEPSREALDELTFEDMKTIESEGFEVTIASEAEKSALKILVFLDGNLVFVVLAMDTNIESASVTTEEFANYVLDADVKDEEVSFNEDGTSTGGVFDRMPPADDKLVSEQATVTDEKLFDEEE